MVNGMNIDTLNIKCLICLGKFASLLPYLEYFYVLFFSSQQLEDYLNTKINFKPTEPDVASWATHYRGFKI